MKISLVFVAAVCFMLVLVTAIDALDLILALPTKGGPSRIISYHQQPVLFVSYIAISIPIPFHGGAGFLICLSIKTEIAQKKDDEKQRVLLERKQKEKQAHLEQLIVVKLEVILLPAFRQDVAEGIEA